MKFTYWSGNKKQLEAELKKRENSLEDLALRLGMDTDKIKVSYNYKDQTNKAKEARKKVVNLKLYKEEQEEAQERANTVIYNNGAIAIRVNDKVVSTRVESKLAVLPQLSEEESWNYAADIEADIVASYISNIGVQQSNAYQRLEESLKNERLEPLVPLFIASEIKMNMPEFIGAVRVVQDPYFYESVDNMQENDWQDLFDICNYHRLNNKSNFEQAMNKVYPGIHLNSRLNKVIATLEKYSEQYKSIENAMLETLEQ